VLLTGDKVDPRERFSTKTDDAPPPARAEILIPDADGKYRKSEVGGVDHSTTSQPPPTPPAEDLPEKEDDASVSIDQRARKKPKVIDARQDPGKAETWETEQIGGGHARGGTAWADDEAGASRGEQSMMIPDAEPAPEVTDVPERPAPEVIEAATPKKPNRNRRRRKCHVPQPPKSKARFWRKPSSLQWLTVCAKKP